MTLIEKIKNADARDDQAALMSLLGDLLDEDVDRSLELVMTGAKKFLKRGVFSKNYENAFWSSNLPQRFGVAFAEHPLHAHKFWISLFNQGAAQIPLLTHLAQSCPDALENGTRRSRAFLNESVWPALQPILRANNLQSLADECEIIRGSRKASEEVLHGFTPLLKKISAESLVVHFAVWLEKQYFAEQDDRIFRVKLPEHVEVLQEGLKRRRAAHSTGAELPKEIKEIGKLVCDVFRRVRGKPDTLAETENLFRALERWLSIGHLIEMFSNHGWNLAQTPWGLTVQSKSKKQQDAWQLQMQKFYAQDTFEIWMPLNERELHFMRECYKSTPNPESGHALWHIYTAERFLAKNCGAEVIDSAASQMGFAVHDALSALICNKACYEMTFVAPRASAKTNGEDFRCSLRLLPTFEDAVAYRNDEPTIVWRPACDPRPFSIYVEQASDFPATAKIPPKTIRAIYDYFAQDIHGENIELGNKLLLQNKHCDILIPRIFSGDIKTLLFNELFSKFDAQVARVLEGRINTIFSWKTFSTLWNEKLGGDGEIDVLAYRDGTLFVVEAKATRIRAMSSEVWQVRERLQKGASQLDRIIEVLPEYWPNLHEKLGAPQNLDDVHVIPILISNSLEFDHFYFNGHLKISDFELEGIFSGNPLWVFLLNAYHELQFDEEPPSPLEMNARMANISEDDLLPYRLYDAISPSVDDLIACIEESRFWSLVFGQKFELTPLRKM